MSEETRRFGDSADALQSVYEAVREWYPVPVVSLAMLFMFWVRTQAMDRFMHDGSIYFTGNDPWYHYRSIQYVVEHWPWTMPFDVWTYFPYGQEVDHFGTFYDQIVATAALIVGAGDPSVETVKFVTLLAPAVLGTLVAVPVYFIGKRLGGRLTGVFAVVLLALLPGTFLQRANVGFADHHAAEVLFQSLAVLGTIVALSVAEREKPVYEQVVDRDWAGLRRPLLWSALAGVATAMYMWVWPPAVVIVGVLGLFYVLGLSADYVRGRSPDHVALVGVTSLSVAGLLLLPKFDSFGFATASISLLQLFLTLGVAAGCAFMAWLARQWDAREFDPTLYPVAVGALILAAVGFLAIGLPEAFSTIRTNILRTVAFSQSDTTLTVAEAQSVIPEGDDTPFRTVTNFMTDEYGLVYLTAFAGLVGMITKTVLTREDQSVNLFLIVWAVFTTLMALTQQRFNYYLAVVVVVLSAWLIAQVLELVDVRSVTSVSEIQAYQVIVVVVILLLVLGTFVGPLAVPQRTAVENGQRNGPGYYNLVWGDGLEWVQENTPAEGTYGNPDGDPMNAYGTFRPTGDYDYPEGAYGVMSWWDYGHWITVLGNRIPDANPFQQGPRSASAFFQARSEATANLMLEALPSVDNGRQLAKMSRAELEAVVANQSEQAAGEDTRYVMIDSQMAASKFGAIATWTGNGSGQYFSGERYSLRSQNVTLPVRNARYRSTMLSRLYNEDASGLEHYRLVHEVDSFVLTGPLLAANSNGQLDYRGLQSLRLNGNWSQLQQLRSQVRQSNAGNQVMSIGGNSYMYNASVASAVKTFERVPGATLTGQANVTNATTVTAMVQLRATSTNRTFVYRQQVRTGPNGEFEITVPYATSEQVGPAEGYTDEAVVATGNYTVYTGDLPPTVQQFEQVLGTLPPSLVRANLVPPQQAGNATVPETAVLEGDTIQVELTEVPERNTSDGNQTGNQTGNETAGNATDGNATGGNATDGNDSSAVAGPTVAGPGVAWIGASAERIAPVRSAVRVDL